MKGGGK